MKNAKPALLCLVLVFGSCLTTVAQHSEGGNFTPTAPCLMEEERSEIRELIKHNQSVLGLKPNNSNAKTVVDDLTFPLQMVNAPPGFFNYYSVSNYVDQDNSTGIQDYNCSSTSYNGHRGSDYFTFPFWWYLYENDLVEVIASAPGTIVLKQDGNADTNCTPSGQWNAVYIQHADGSVLWYGHLKAGSLTAKGLGETVEQGEYLGVVASSGNSNGPHLHLEYYNAANQLVDPYAGPCNSLNDNSLWLEQPPYTRPKVNAVLTHAGVPSINCLLQNEVADLKNVFYAGDVLYVAVYLTDYVAGSVAVTRIYRPDNTLFNSYNSFNNQFSYQWFWSWVSYPLTATAMPGTWTVESQYRGVTYTHEFEFINEPTSVDDLQASAYRVFPNPATDQLVVAWNGAADATLVLYDQQGRVLWQGSTSGNTQQQVDVNGYPAGLYFLQLRTDAGSSIRKIVVE